MSSTFTHSLKAIFGFSFLFFISTSSIKAQTSLVAGDIAFTGYSATPNAPQSDEFSFVLLKNCAAGTIINFTDNAWGNDNQFRTAETTVAFTLGAAKVAGTEIKISGPPAGSATATFIGGASAGTCTGTTLSLSVNGDQVIAYQGTAASPTIISGIHMNVYNGSPDPSVTNATNWDNLPSTTANTFFCFKPPTLTTGTNAIWIGTQAVISSERNNARFNAATAISGGANLGTVAGVRAACNNKAFWDAEFAGSGAVPTWPLPSGANFLSVLPLHLLNFEATNNLSYVTANWQTADEINVSQYELERSFDNIKFDRIATIAAINNNASVNNYSYLDKQSLQNSASLIYYRLKMLDNDGKFTYSAIQTIRNKKNISLAIDNMSNPVTDFVRFNIISKKATRAEIQVSDANGRIVVNKMLQLSAGNSSISLPETINLTKGMYFLKIVTSNETIVVSVIK
jgi:Secretion system C-terminal sorting domain